MRAYRRERGQDALAPRGPPPLQGPWRRQSHLLRSLRKGARGRQDVGMGRTWRRAVFGAVALMAPTCLAAYSFDDSGRFADAADWPAFAAMLERHQATAAELVACRADAQDCPGHLKRVRVVLERGATLTREQQMRLVNRFVNNRRYSHDRPRRMEGADGEARLKSHWQTLGEFLARGGDCEDFALAKYFLLREFGIPAPDMRRGGGARPKRRRAPRPAGGAPNRRGRRLAPRHRQPHPPAQAGVDPVRVRGERGGGLGPCAGAASTVGSGAPHLCRDATTPTEKARTLFRWGVNPWLNPVPNTHALPV